MFYSTVQLPIVLIWELARRKRKTPGIVQRVWEPRNSGTIGTRTNGPYARQSRLPPLEMGEKQQTAYSPGEKVKRRQILVGEALQRPGTRSDYSSSCCIKISR